MTKVGEPQPSSLADEIRETENSYVDAAVEQFRRAMQIEYVRLRGYALEGERDTIGFQVSVTFGFDPANRFVVVESVPAFTPRVGTFHTTVSAQPV